jgi:dipeptidyl aminopeptidase/acylaminoacyl peptidase
MAKKKDFYQATLRDMLALEFPANVRISSDGTKVAFTVRTTNWKDNKYESHCCLYDDVTGVTHQLTRYGDVHQLEWLNGETLGLLKANDGKGQVWLFDGGAGEGWQVTDHKTGVEWFHPFAGGIVFMARDPEKDEKKSRTDQYGKYDHFEQEESASALYFLSLRELAEHQKQVRIATEDEGKKLIEPVIELSKLFKEPIAIKEIIVSPRGDALYLNCWKRDDLVYARETRVFQIRLDAKAALAKYLQKEKAKQAQKKASASALKEKEEKENWSYLGKLSELKLPQGSRVAAVSPDGIELLVGYQERDQMFYTQEDLWVTRVKDIERAPDADKCLRAMTNLTAALDRQLMTVYWTEAGIFADYIDGTRIWITHLDGRGRTTSIDVGVFEATDFHVSTSGKVALSGTNAESFVEVYLAIPAKNFKKWNIKKLTDFGKQVVGWDLGKVETITWQSRDGTTIEGVLRKPSSFDPRKKYPLAIVVHGGPTWFSDDYLLSDLLSGGDVRYYPTLQFNLKEMLVLKPNYRGSLGRGQAFLELNVNNLGIGDLWDVESAVDHLVELGWVDPQKIGCMGWSQGGYISAFVGLHSDKFKAVSVGAGISDWYTYHISNDIPDFTRDYLSGSPFRDRALYEKTAPINNIAKAKTPMLIQHGSEDRRVPTSNAMELYRGLKEMGVPVELFIYPGMAHLITKPRENHAVMYQNLNWFSHYLLGEDLKLE